MSAGPGIWVWAALAALAAATTGLALYTGTDARLSRQIIARFLWRIAMPVAVLLGAPLVVAAQFIELDSRLWQAVIAGGVIATGWLTSAIFAETDKVRRKAERTRDVHKALYAEIGNTLASLYDAGKSDEYAAATLARMESDADFVPFIPQEKHDHIYDAIVGEIDVLPRQTIDPVVAYYSLIKSISALAEDMRGDAFRGLSPERRSAVYSDYIDMRKEAFVFGQYALELILAFSKGGAEAAQRLINNRGAGRSARSPGSE